MNAEKSEERGAKSETEPRGVSGGEGYPPAPRPSPFALRPSLLPTSDRIPALDGLRGLAIAAVLFYHYYVLPLRAAPHSPAWWLGKLGNLSWTGVDLFFVLSGFLLGGILLDHRHAGNLLGVFYRRRFARIFPAYYAWLALSVLATWLAGMRAGTTTRFDGLLGARLPLWSYLSYTQNFVIAQRAYFGPAWLAATWSLAVEEQFYLVLPLLVLLLPPRRLPWLLGALVIAAPAVRTILCWRHQPWQALYVLTPCRCDALFAGVLGAWAVRQARFRAALVARPWLLPAALAGLGAIILLLTRGHRGTDALPIETVGYTVIAFFYLGVLLWSVLTPPRWLARLLGLRSLMALGTISYGVYLSHEGVAGLCHAFLRGRGGEPHLADGGDAGIALLGLALTLGLAWASYRGFEAPFLRWGRRAQYQARSGTEPPRRGGHREGRREEGGERSAATSQT